LEQHPYTQEHIKKANKKITSELSKQAEKSPELKGQFAGLRKYRIENYRVVYVIIDDSVLILKIKKHRNDV
jgi:mRNA interferase RelE/StbE